MAAIKHTKTTLVSKIAKKLNTSKKAIAMAVTALVDEIQNTLKSGGKVSLVGFGTFDVRKRAARKGKNPRTRQTIQIKAKVVPNFKAGKGLRDMVKDTKL